MQYQHMIRKELYRYKELQPMYPMMSLPVDGTEIIMGEWHVVAVGTPPAYDKKIEGIRVVDPVNYVETWEVYALPQDQIDSIINSDAQTAVDAITVDYDVGGTIYTFSGSTASQSGMVTAMAKLEGKDDTKTQKWFTINNIKVNLNRDNFDDLLDIIEPIQEEILDD